MSRESRIYVGNLPHDITRRDLDDLFYKYGNIRDIDLKNRRTPYYAFIDFEDYRDADDAVKGRNNYSYEGYRLKVEKTRGNGRFGGGGRLVGGHYVPGRPTGPPSKRTNYRVLVEGLPPSGSWQDLKDHMRECGDVCYADVYRDGTGVVEYNCYEDVRQAVKYLHDTKFISHERETSYIRVRDDSRRSRSRSRSSSSRSRSRSRSRRSRSRSRRSRSRSHSRSKSRDRRSRSDSRDRRSKSRDRRSKSKSRDRRSKSRDRRSKSKSRDRRSKSRDRRSKSKSRDRRSKSHDRRSKSKSRTPRSKSRSPRRSRSRS